MVETLSAAIGAYPHTARLRAGMLPSPLLRLVFADIAPISRAFAPMVREARFDVAEMAIGTFLQARACDKPLVLLPVVLAARFQEAALLCRARSDLRPEALAGRRVGVRAYGQTTALWLRASLRETYGVAPDAIRWVTFEDAHVAEMADPPHAERAPAGATLLGMLRDGAIDAAIVGNDVPDDPALRTVIPDPAAAGEAFRARHGLMPINHMVVVRRALAEARPDLVRELMRLFEAGANAAPGAPPVGRAAVSAGVELARRFATEQDMLARPLAPDEVWDGLPPL